MRVCAVHDEAALQARAALAPVYMTLRRMLMQLCGLLLLYRGSRPATREGIATTLAALRQEYKESRDFLDRLHPAVSPDVEYIVSAARYVRIVIAQLERSLAVRGGGVERAESVLPLLQRAQRLLLAASDDQAGLTMVGFSHACCCAPAALPRQYREF
jgi:hypothetical protein